MKNDKNLMTKNIIAMTLVAIGIYRLGYIMGSKSQETTETVIVEGEAMSNIGGDIKAYKSQGKLICYVTSPRGSIQEVPCPK